jgi:hypothetical protein
MIEHKQSTKAQTPKRWQDDSKKSKPAPTQLNGSLLGCWEKTTFASFAHYFVYFEVKSRVAAKHW